MQISSRTFPTILAALLGVALVERVRSIHFEVPCRELAQVRSASLERDGRSSIEEDDSSLGFEERARARRKLKRLVSTGIDLGL